MQMTSAVWSPNRSSSGKLPKKTPKRTPRKSQRSSGAAKVSLAHSSGCVCRRWKIWYWMWLSI